MKSNIGFLQVLILLIFVFNVIGLLNFNVFIMSFLIIVAWIDSYIKTDIGGGDG